MMHLSRPYAQENMKARRTRSVDRLQAVRHMVKGHVRADAYSQLRIGNNVSHTAKRERADAEESLKQWTGFNPAADNLKLVEASPTKDVLLEESGFVYKLQPSVEIVVVEEVRG